MTGATGSPSRWRRPSSGALRSLAKQLGLRTAGDLLRHYPRRYLDRAELTDLGKLQVDEPTSPCVAEVQLGDARQDALPQRAQLLDVVVTDGRSDLRPHVLQRIRAPREPS